MGAAALLVSTGAPAPPKPLTPAGTEIELSTPTATARNRNAAPAPGVYNVCYVNAFQVQPGADAQWLIDGRDLILRDGDGRPVIDSDCGEAVLDTSDGARRGHQTGFDFGIAEECLHYSECDSYTDVYGANVIDIEYSDQPLADFLTASEVKDPRISVVRRDRGLVPAGAPGHLAQWCR